MGSTHRTHVSYIDRTRAYYAALGYEKPYQYAHHADVPFARLASATGRVPRGPGDHRQSLA
jgi:hypothetical protein